MSNESCTVDHGDMPCPWDGALRLPAGDQHKGDAMTDNGSAVLALRRCTSIGSAACCRPRHGEGDAMTDCGHDQSYIDALSDKWQEAEATIANLRAALDGLVEAAEAVTEPGVWTDEVEARIAYWKRVDALRAALATAKEVIDGA
jgi:hypothetical protein